MLQIVCRPEGFQLEAVDAANRRLSERDIAQEERNAVLAFYNEIDREARLRAEKIDYLKEQAADLLQPIIQPGPDLTPRKWLNVFLLTLGLQYGWLMIQTLIAILWRQNICELFGVDRITKTRTVLYTSVIALLGFCAFWLL